MKSNNSKRRGLTNWLYILTQNMCHWRTDCHWGRQAQPVIISSTDSLPALIRSELGISVAARVLVSQQEVRRVTKHRPDRGQHLVHSTPCKISSLNILGKKCWYKMLSWLGGPTHWLIFDVILNFKILLINSNQLKFGSSGHWTIFIHLTISI